MVPPRPKTDMYLAAVERAVGRRGQWVEIPRRFDTEFNASITASCLREGYLRARPRDGDSPVSVRGKRCIRTAAPVEVRVEKVLDGWALRICAE